MLLAAEAVSKPEYKLTADEAGKHVDELQRARQERLDGLNRLEIARTGPVSELHNEGVAHFLEFSYSLYIPDTIWNIR